MALAPSQYNKDSDDKYAPEQKGYNPRSETTSGTDSDWSSYESFVADRERWNLVFTPDQIGLLEDMIACIEVLEAKVQAGGEVDLSMFKTELDNLKRSLDYFKNTSPTNKPDDMVTDTIKKALSTPSEAGPNIFLKLQGIKSKTNRIEEQDAKPNNDPVARKNLEKELEKEISDMIEKLAPSSEIKNEANKKLKEDIEKITEKEDSKKRGLNIMQKVVVWFNLNVLKKDAKWLKSYVDKNAFKGETGREEKIKTLLKEKYPEEQKKLEKEEEEIRLAAEAKRLNKEAKSKTVQPETKKAQAPTPLPEATRPTEPQPAGKSEKEVMTNLKEKVPGSSILELVGNGKENPLANVQEGLNQLITETAEEHRNVPVATQISKVTEKLVTRILGQNLPVTEEQIEAFYTAVTNRAQEKYGDDERYLKKLLNEIDLGKATIRAITEQRQKQFNLYSQWHATACENAIKELGANADPKELAEKQEQLLSYQFIDAIVEQNKKTGAGLSHGDIEARRSEFRKLVDDKVIQFRMATNANGYAVPSIIVTDEKPSENKGEAIQYKPKSGKQILNLLTGGSFYDNEASLAFGYQFKLNGPDNTSLQMIGIALNQELQQMQKEDPDVVDYILAHEIDHAAIALRKEAYYVPLEKRIVDMTLEAKPDGTSRYKIIQELGKEFDPEKALWVVESYLKGNPVEEQDKDAYNALIKKLTDYKDTKGKPHFIEQRQQKLYEARKYGWQGAFDEINSLAKHPTMMLDLTMAHVNNFEITKESDRASLALIRILNLYPEQYAEARESNKKDTLALNREAVSQLLGIGLGTEMDEITGRKMIGTILDAIECDPDNPETPAELKILKNYVTDLAGKVPAVGQDEFIKNYLNLVTQIAYGKEGLEGLDLGAEKTEEFTALFQEFLNLSPEATADRQAKLEELKKTFSDLNIKLPYLDLLMHGDSQQAMNFINLLLIPPTAEEFGRPQTTTEMGLPEDAMEVANRQAIHPTAIFRHAGIHAANAFFYKGVKLKDRMGMGMGEKVGLNMRFRHAKDLGPNLLRFGNLNKKFFVDGLGVGMDDFRTDGNDGWEAMYFLTGLSIHKMPGLANVPKLWDNSEFVRKHPGFKMDKKAFRPDAIIEPGIDAFYIGVLRDIFSRISAENYYDPQSIVRLILEFGGFDYDYAGQPVAKKSTYATNDDAYRANQGLADFITSTIMTGRNANNKDMLEIRNRMVADTIQVDGKDVVVTEYKGNMVKAKVVTDSKGLTKAVIEKGKDGEPIVVQKGALKIGQISKNVMDEIREIMVYDCNLDKDGNPLKKPKNKFGLERMNYDEKVKTFEKNWARAKTMDKIGKLMMEEDSLRRKTDQGTYTITDLLTEIESVQNAAMRPLIDDDGNPDQSAIDRLKKQSIVIGDIPDDLEGQARADFIEKHSVDIQMAKDFLKEFSLARSKKVLTVGVWEKDFDYVMTGEGDAAQRIDYKQALGSTILANEKDLVADVKTGKFTYFHDGKYYAVEISPYDAQIRHVYEIKSDQKVYSASAKLKFESKQTGHVFELDPIQGLTKEILLRYYGKTIDFEGIDKDGKRVKVRGRKEYDTKEGQMFDDVYDTLEKYRRGRLLSYNYAVKLYQFDKYRDYSKVKMEYYMGILQIEDLVRKGVIAATVLGSLIPSLAFLVSPGMIIGTFLWSIAVQPFLVRLYKGWASRIGAAIENQDEVKSMQGLFWKLGSDTQPTSFGELELARASYETVKFKYKSVLKEFNNGAKWNTNIFTNIFGAAWDKVSTKPF